MTGNVNLRLSGALDQLRIVWQTGEALLESLEFEEDSEGTRYNVLVSIQEMVTNVFRHAYGGDDARAIEVDFECGVSGFSVEIRDDGPEFDPLAYDLEGALAADTEVPESIGGYGIMIARTVMDDVAWERRDGRNCLRLTKHAATPAPSECVSPGPQ